MKTPSNGFTLIEVSVVLAIVGILIAIAVPLFFNQKAKAQEVEARQNLPIILKREEEHYLEYGSFITDWEKLALGLPQQTDSYTYELFITREQGIGVLVNSLNKDLRSYLGGVKVINTRGQVSLVTVQCRAVKQGDILKQQSLMVSATQIHCGSRVRPIK